jgi:cytochrome P450
VNPSRAQLALDFFPIKNDLHPNPPTAIIHIHGFATDIVHARRWQSTLATENRDDVLSWFVEGDDEHDDEALCDVVRSFLIAKRETTSSALIWFFWLISSRPD